MPIVEEYISLTAKWKAEYGENTVVLMQVGKFFEMYVFMDIHGSITGINIQDISDKCDLLIAKKSQQIKGKQVVMAGVPECQLEKYIKKIQGFGYTCPVYTQNSNTTRSLSEIVSPGTYFGSEVGVITNNSVCIWIQKVEKTKYTPEIVIMGIACIDVNTGASRISQFESAYYKDPSTYDDIERQISIISPHEVIIVFRGVNTTERKCIVGYLGLSNQKVHILHENDESDFSKCSKNAERQTYQAELMNKFFPSISHETLTGMYQTHQISLQSYTLLLDFVNTHNPSILNKITFAVIEHQEDTLLLANHSLRQLNIISDQRQSGKCSCVASQLDNCMTKMGNRKFRYDITRPTNNPSVLQEKYGEIETTIQLGIWKDFRTKLKSVGDLDMFFRKMVSGKISPRDITKLHTDLNLVKEVIDLIRDTPLFPKFKNLDELTEKISEMIEIISTSFDLSKCALIDHISDEKLGRLSPDEACFVSSGACSDIDKSFHISTSSSTSLIKIQEYLSSIVASHEKKPNNYVKIYETPKCNPVLIGTTRRMKILMNDIEKHKDKDNVKPTLEDGTAIDIRNITLTTYGNNKKDMKITSPQIEGICSSLQKHREQLIQHLEVFFRKFCVQLSERGIEFDTISRFIAWTDCLQNACYIANKYNLVKPELTYQDKSCYSMTGLRHPLIEELQTQETYVPNDISMGKHTNGVLLYGTNAVGKSSFIKSIGICIIMAQSGLYVPCSSMGFTPYNKIFTRILGNDNIFKGLSTFAVEMSELRTILNQSDKNSLVIGDELCSGTESNSARSIFTAGIEWLNKIQSTFIFATHFHEINDYEEIEQMSLVRKMHMSVYYDREHGCLVYDRKLKDGPGEDMYGLEVCKSLNLNEDFLERAYELRHKYGNQIGSILDSNVSHYNSKKILNNCELCGFKGEDVHHLAHQSNANKNGYVNEHRKNHVANLMNICKECHNKIHSAGKQHRKFKTSEGYKTIITDK